MNRFPSVSRGSRPVLIQASSKCTKHFQQICVFWWGACTTPEPKSTVPLSFDSVSLHDKINLQLASSAVYLHWKNHQHLLEQDLELWVSEENQIRSSPTRKDLNMKGFAGKINVREIRNQVWLLSQCFVWEKEEMVSQVFGSNQCRFSCTCFSANSYDDEASCVPCVWCY